MNKERNGSLIVFEGIDGSGKTTQSKILVDCLNIKNKEIAIWTKNQTEGSVGELIQSVLDEEKKLDSLALRVCFVADRVDQTNTLIKPAIEKGKIVVSDRYSWSTAAYGYILGIETMELILELDKKLGNLEPDLSILVDIDPKIAIERINSRGKKLDIFEKQEKFEKVREAYFILANRHKEKLIIVDGNNSIDDIHQTIINEIKNRGFLQNK